MPKKSEKRTDGTEGRTEFQQWIAYKGVKKIAVAAGIKETTVASWLYEGFAPRPANLAKLRTAYPELSCDVIYGGVPC